VRRGRSIIPHGRDDNRARALDQSRPEPSRCDVAGRALLFRRKVNVGSCPTVGPRLAERQPHRLHSVGASSGSVSHPTGFDRAEGMLDRIAPRPHGVGRRSFKIAQPSRCCRPVTAQRHSMLDVGSDRAATGRTGSGRRPHQAGNNL
jgi:hypothetical protein